MELSAFARTILFERDLASKLVSPSAFSDEHPGAPEPMPDAPARPDGLELKDRGEAKVDFPASHTLADPRQRGIVLHFFANHELLAMELMALALLRFPDAPEGFRMGLARTILEEQKHLTLYMNRMRELGVAFGEVPVNRFFWDTTANMRSPLDYLTEMSLTFEQANLDYSRHFRDLFTKLQDCETARLMDVVYQEEIGHVKHGVVWFNRLRPKTGDDWDEYQALLPEPLSPVRAKGLGFDADARRLAGLSERFIRELSVYKFSKGRPPVVYFFNPGCETEILNPTPAFNPPAALTMVARDLGSLMQFLTKADDVVWVEEKPSTPFLEDLQRAGLPIPQFVRDAKELAGRQVAAFEPWGKSPSALRRAEETGAKTTTAPHPLPDRRFFSKAYAAGLLGELHPGPLVGVIATSAAEAEAKIESHFARSARTLVVKAGLGSSGRHMQRIGSPGLDPKQAQWLANLFANRQSEVVIEPWLDRVLDLSVQMNVANGKKTILGTTRFLTDARGQYVGHKLGRKFTDLAPELRRALYEGGLLERLETTARQVAARLARDGFVGPAGIDALVHETPGGFDLKEIVEINPRYTMGRIAWELDHYVDHAVEADWLHLNAKQVAALGYGTFSEFVAAGRARYPLVLKPGSDRVFSDGFLATTDPASARQLITVLLVGSARAFVQGKA